jgi:hypothetical protein
MLLRSLTTCAPNTAYTLTYKDGVASAYLQAVVSGFSSANLIAKNGFLVTRSISAVIQYPVFTYAQLEAVTALASFTCNQLVAKFGKSDELTVATLQANMSNVAVESPRIVNIHDNEIQ